MRPQQEKPLAQRNLPRMVVVAWQALSFFAADIERQRQNLGPAGEWYEDARADRPHANYLRALAEVFCTYAGALADFAPGLESPLQELAGRLEDDIGVQGPGWTSAALADDPSWGETRRLARACLEALGLQENFMRQPIDFAKLIDIDHTEWCKQELKRNPALAVTRRKS
jgi:hypothetical protein